MVIFSAVPEKLPGKKYKKRKLHSCLRSLRGSAKIEPLFWGISSISAQVNTIGLFGEKEMTYRIFALPLFGQLLSPFSKVLLLLYFFYRPVFESDLNYFYFFL